MSEEIPANSSQVPDYKSLLKPGLVLAETYRLEKIIGQGAMGQIWLVTHLPLNQTRAIKFMLDQSTRSRFILNEAANSLRLIHPNIVRVNDLNLYQDIPFIVMEYVKGHDLKTHLLEKPILSLNETSDILKQLASALDYAHKQGLVHRDIKPANIMLTDENVVKLADFGIVKDLVKGEDLTQGSIGTPTYMSPEQARREALPQSDQYSLGIMLYQMLTGKLPFRGNQVDLLIQHATAIPIPLFQLNPTIPKEISQIVLKTLAKAPNERFDSVLELAEAFEKAVLEDHLLISSPTVNISLPALPVRPPVTPTAKHNLPEQFNRFIGRAEQIEELTNNLTLTDTRLLTLVGMGGTGKTRLAIELGLKILDKYAEIWLVELIPVVDEKLVLQAIAEVIGVKENSQTSLYDGLINSFLDKKILLILDNCEHLIAGCASVSQKLLRNYPQLQILATSREPLKITAEKTLSLQPFSFPDLGTQELIQANSNTYAEKVLLNNEAIQLFVERAQAVNPKFSYTAKNLRSIVEICRKIGGIPLAIELAAARVKVLTVEQIDERLNQNQYFSVLKEQGSRRQSNHQTLQVLLDWSYNLLSEAEQALFRRLSLFMGSYTIEDVEIICSNQTLENLATDKEWSLELDTLDLLDYLNSLADKSLLQFSEQNGVMRYQLLEIIRQSAHQKAVETAELEILKPRFSAYYLNIALEAQPNLIGSNPKEWLAKLEVEQGNLRATINLLVTEGSPATISQALQLVNAIWRFWHAKGYISEGLNWLETAISVAEKQQLETPELVASYRNIGILWRLKGELAQSKEYLEAGYKLAQKIDYKLGIADTANVLGIIAADNEEFGVARQRFEEYLQVFRELNEQSHITLALNNLGMVARLQGDYSAARTYYEEGLALKRKIGAKSVVALTLSSLVDVTLAQADYPATRQYLKEGLGIYQNLEELTDSIYLLEYAACYLALLNQPENAARLVGLAAKIRQETGIALSNQEQKIYEERLKIAQATLTESEWEAHFNQGNQMTTEAGIQLALSQI